jgi:hypothetical protein
MLRLLPYISTNYENQGEKELTEDDHDTYVVTSMRITDDRNTSTCHAENSVSVEVVSATNKVAPAGSNAFEHQMRVQ